MVRPRPNGMVKVFVGPTFSEGSFAATFAQANGRWTLVAEHPRTDEGR